MDGAEEKEKKSKSRKKRGVQPIPRPIYLAIGVHAYGLLITGANEGASGRGTACVPAWAGLQVAGCATALAEGTTCN